MKNIFIGTLVLSCFFSIFRAEAQENFYRDILVSEETVPESVDEEAAADAVEQAKRLLNTRPQALRKQNFPQLRQRIKKAELPSEGNNTAAPFGLIWGATIQETKNQGVLLTRIDEKDYVNNFSAAHLPKAISDFDKVDVTFGDNDELWRIIGYGGLLDDTPDASKVMRLYKIYNDLLKKKYGHAEEFFTPAQIEVESKDAKGRKIMVKEDAPIGNPNFLKQLQNGDATLYSTYYNDDVGAALAVNVDGDGKITVTDALLILQKSVGKIDKFPVEN